MALVDEIDHPDTGLVSRDFLRAELQTLRTELQALRADLIGTIWRVVLTVFGIQVVLVGALVAVLDRGAGERRERGRRWPDPSITANCPEA